MNTNKGEESASFLNVIKREEYIKILSKFEHSQIWKRTSELFNKNKDLPERDYKHELEKLKKEIKNSQNKIKERQSCFPPSFLSSNFESNICTAVPR